ncbi:hypothetical protein N9C85_00475 [Synechococcus sp. AH-224-I15]|nr:hypothetical protein [Synechococcus sp. AH-224-I15]
MKKICLVSHQELPTNSGYHVAAIARNLASKDLVVIAAFPSEPETKPTIHSNLLLTSTSNLLKDLNLLKDVDLLYYWSPRLRMEKFHRDLCKLHNRDIQYFIHLEDNDLFILKETFNLERKEIVNMILTGKGIEDPDYINLNSVGKFIANSVGITALTPELFQVVPPGIPTFHFWPGYDTKEASKTNNKKDSDLRKELCINPDHSIITYTGNVHSSNKSEVRSLYIAIAVLNREGYNVSLIRTGKDHVELFSIDEKQSIENNCIELGFVDRKLMFRVQALADILIQPGNVNIWNSFRVPSKIPEFLSSGKPTILPKTNIGLHLRDNIDAICLDNANAISIARSVKSLLSNRNIMKEIGDNGKSFAECNLNWSTISIYLQHFINKAL